MARVGKSARWAHHVFIFLKLHLRAQKYQTDLQAVIAGRKILVVGGEANYEYDRMPHFYGSEMVSLIV